MILIGASWCKNTLDHCTNRKLNGDLGEMANSNQTPADVKTHWITAKA
jgi:hypothetical protein